MKYIKEFNQNNERDYNTISKILLDLYDIETTLADFQNFEKSEIYDVDFTDSEYIKGYVNQYLGGYDDTIDENVACVTGGNVSGMGAVVSAQPGGIPGTTGTTGSGDIGSGSIANNKNIRTRDNFLPRSRRKNKAKSAIKMMRKTSSNVPFEVGNDNQVDFKQPKNDTIVKSFSDFVNKNK